ncbi:CLUMA_CG019954, isoform A [Clunio marinus]|uniref:CLUMA_CG019954, isoform A n=1 Tax=Clunio marinus TaxID=568069 RepID=A0A1J1J3C0_9DIPT|nr:CLUMA_CG019954, isoform A [Clunio marinus]
MKRNEMRLKQQLWSTLNLFTHNNDIIIKPLLLYLLRSFSHSERLNNIQVSKRLSNLRCTMFYKWLCCEALFAKHNKTSAEIENHMKWSEINLI